MKQTLAILTIILISIMSYGQLQPHIITTATEYQFQFNGETKAIIDTGGYVESKQFTLQVHRLANYNCIADWDTLKWDIIVDSETNGEWSLGADSTYIVPPDSGLYEFCGCFHLKNNKGSSINTKFLSYVTNEEGDTARCSQLNETISKEDGSYITLTYCGTMVAGENSKIRVNFKTGDANLDLQSDGDLPKAVSASINLYRINKN